MIEGLRFRDDSRFGGGSTRPHLTVCLHWNICFCLKVRIAELLVNSFSDGFSSWITYNIIQIIDTPAEYGCFGIVSALLLLQSLKIWHLYKGFRADASGGHATKDGKSWPRAALSCKDVKDGVVKVSQNTNAFQCYQKGISQSFCKKWWAWCGHKDGDNDHLMPRKSQIPSLIWAIELRRKQICGPTVWSFRLDSEKMTKLCTLKMLECGQNTFFWPLPQSCKIREISVWNISVTLFLSLLMSCSLRSHWPILLQQHFFELPKNATKISQCSVASMLYLMWQLMDVNCTAAMWEYLAIQSRVRLAAVFAKK